MSAERKPEFFAGKDMQIGIIGCGYVGLPLALRFADVGQRVTGFDLDQTKVDKLNAGQSYIQHISADKIREHVQGEALFRDERFHEAARDGRGADLRTDAAGRAARAGPELRREHGEGDCAEPAAESADRARKHHLSRSRPKSWCCRSRKRAGCAARSTAEPAARK